MAAKAQTDTAVPAAFDLAEIEAVDSDSLVINHPVTGQPTTWVLQIAGPGHPVTEAINKEAQRERLDLERRIETTRRNGKKWKGDDADPDAERAKTEQRIARRIIGWSPVTHNGQPFPYSQENALSLISEPRWTKVWQQILEHFDSDAAFTKRSAKT